MLHDAGLVALGFFGAVGLRLAVALVRRLFGLASAAEAAERGKREADARAAEIESKLRLAELEVAERRAKAEAAAPAPGRVVARPITR